MKQAIHFSKKILFDNASGLIMSALFLTFVNTSCKKQTTDVLVPVSDEVAYAKAAKPVSPPTISLKVTVNDATGYNITSDGSVDYLNGTQSVQAVIDKNGNFIFNTNTNSNRPASRSLNFNFNEPITVFTTPPATNSSNSYNLETLPSTVISGFTPIQNLTTGQSECVSFRAVAISGNTIDWRVTFHAGFDDRTESTTAFASVTRNDDTHWTITSLGNCLPGSVQNKAAYRAGNANILYGYYNIPFSFTLTAQ